MGLHASCWFLIEYIIIPAADDGSLEWFYLRFYIHPFFLFFCRIFLRLKWLQKQLLLILVFLYKITSFILSSVILRFYRFCIIFVCSFTRFNNTTSTEVVNNEVAVDYEISEIKNVQNQIILFRYDQGSVLLDVHEHQHEHQERVFVLKPVYKVNGTILDDHVEEVQNVEDSSNSVCSSPSDDHLNIDAMSLSDSDLEIMDMHLPSVLSNSVCSSPSDDHLNMDAMSLSDSDLEIMDMHLPSVCSSNSPAVIEKESTGQREEEEEEVVVDIFYDNYTEKMRWFDVLILDRTCGISAVLNKQFVGHGSNESVGPVDFSIQYISWGNNNTARKRLLRSLESDLEMAYVAQACLTWEALHHQYRKVESLAIFSSNGVFYDNTAERFQKFQILLERFMENEWCDDKGKRYWNFVQRMSSFKSLLQVPQVSGYVEEEKGGGIMKGEGMKATVVLKAIEKCIKAFGLFVKTEDDPHKPGWKLRGLLWTNNYPPLEDPRDFHLLCQLTNSLQKKKLCLRDLEGKKRRSWLRGRSAVEKALVESDEKKLEVLFTTIDMQLVSRVLKMSLVSTSQLKWCQEKLNNIDFIEGRKLMRASVNGPLFPS